MESFDITINRETYVIVYNNSDNYSFTVFNHKTCHIITKNDGAWETVEHRFGAPFLPLGEIGEAIDGHYEQMLQSG